MPDFHGFRIEAVESPAPAPDPQCSGVILDDIVDIALGQRVLVEGIVAQGHRLGTVVPGQAVLRGEPQKPAPVLENIVDVVMRDPFGCSQSGEPSVQVFLSDHGHRPHERHDHGNAGQGNPTTPIRWEVIHLPSLRPRMGKDQRRY